MPNINNLQTLEATAANLAEQDRSLTKEQHYARLLRAQPELYAASEKLPVDSTASR